MVNICERVYDLNGTEVTANDICTHIIDRFEAGKVITLRNNQYTFWADVECVKCIGKRYWFRSLMYGWCFIVNFNNNTVLKTH